MRWETPPSHSASASLRRQLGYQVTNDTLGTDAAAGAAACVAFDVLGKVQHQRCRRAHAFLEYGGRTAIAGRTVEREKRAIAAVLWRAPRAEKRGIAVTAIRQSDALPGGIHQDDVLSCLLAAARPEPGSALEWRLGTPAFHVRRPRV